MTCFYCTSGGEGCFKMPLLLQGRVQKVLWQLELAGGSTYTGVPSVPDLGH